MVFRNLSIILADIGDKLFKQATKVMKNNSYIIPHSILNWNYPTVTDNFSGKSKDFEQKILFFWRPPKKNFFKFLPSPAKNTKSIISQKTKNRTKKVIAKNERQINSKIACKFGHF